MKLVNKEKLLAHLMIYSVNNRWITKTNEEIAWDLKCEPYEVQFWLSVMATKKELHMWEDQGQRYISIFENR